jgi:PKD repeat protein
MKKFIPKLSLIHQLFILITIVVVSSCSKCNDKRKPNFSINGNKDIAELVGEVGRVGDDASRVVLTHRLDTVTVEDISDFKADIDSRTWDFGDGKEIPSAGPIARFVPSKEGYYKITLCVNGNKEQSISKEFRVLPARIEREPEPIVALEAPKPAPIIKTRPKPLPPKDRDLDGIADKRDKCPDQFGLAELNGCPKPVDGDKDGDGIMDSQDGCPSEAGTPIYNGCPVVKDYTTVGLISDNTSCGDADNPSFSVAMYANEECILNSAYLWANAAGKVRVTLSSTGGQSETITEGLTEGKNQISFSDFSTTLAKGTTYTLYFESVGGANFKNVKNCGLRSHANKGLSVTSNAHLFDINIAYFRAK